MKALGKVLGEGAWRGGCALAQFSNTESSAGSRGAKRATGTG